MINDPFTCGIVGFGLYLPEPLRTYKDIAALSGLPEEVVHCKLGINQTRYPEEKDQTSDMAVWAAQDCLRNTRVDPKEIDLIIYFGENYGDYPIFPFAAKVQGAIGAVNAWYYEMDCKCGTCIIALDQAKKYMMCEKHINTVMLVGGYRNVDKVDYRDSALTFMYDVSSGGCAAILQKGFDQRVVLESVAIADGRFAEAIIVPGGGSKTPFTPENINNDYLKCFRLADGRKFRDELGAVTMQNLANVTRMACEKSGLSLSDLDFVCPLHMKPSAHRQFLSDLGLSSTQSFYLADFGHTGQFDPIISMQMADKSSLIKQGDIVALVAMGIGYNWTAGIVRW
jgi:3-oxoacyl-[acyl-carrier-protein] synthase III